MSSILAVEFRAIALACDELNTDLRGVQIVDSGHGIRITTGAGVAVTVARYTGGFPSAYQSVIGMALADSLAPGRHHEGVPAVDVMAEVWLDSLLSGNPVRTPLERECGVIYG